MADSNTKTFNKNNNPITNSLQNISSNHNLVGTPINNLALDNQEVLANHNQALGNQEETQETLAMHPNNFKQAKW